jgi:hypothetical protein
MGSTVCLGGGLYAGGKDKPATALTDKTLMKLELHTAEEEMKAVGEDGVARGGAQAS